MAKSKKGKDASKKSGRERSLENLRPAKKGEPSRNPKGRPPNTKYYSETLREILSGNEIEVNWTINGKKKKLKVTADKNFYYGVSASQIMQALKGDHKAAKEIVDRIEGKAMQPVDHTTKGEKIDTVELVIKKYNGGEDLDV